ncbi:MULTISPECIES: hypothetical protein [Nostocales]|uniref:Uncharacterized protein n=3 Tax=Nostocales TaxID=1161 RepID=A0A8S9T6G0_9CYAN|nr:hypothetical protein [Tolypothrix bouteillei]KAF3888151.1 hypothetical protein DA73_0400023645 [Tolypothrix bouteillei VB521301]
MQKQNTINLEIEYVTPGQSNQPKKSINHKLLKSKTNASMGGTPQCTAYCDRKSVLFDIYFSNRH